MQTSAFWLHWGFVTGPKVLVLRKDEASIDPQGCWGLAKASRMGRAEPEEPALNMDVCLLFLGCAVVNGSLSSCNPLRDRASGEGRMCAEVGLTHCMYRVSLCSLFWCESRFFSLLQNTGLVISYFPQARFPQISTILPCTRFFRTTFLF